jgi:hypothetical protein
VRARAKSFYGGIAEMVYKLLLASVADVQR